MKKVWLFNLAIVVILILTACGAPSVSSPVPVTPSLNPSITTPCTGAPAPTQWHHVVVLMFENKTYDQVMGRARYITSLAEKCATVLNWQDADTKVNGAVDGKYNSKPNYATLTSGLSPTSHGLIDDTYTTTTKVDNLFNQLNLAGKSFKDYYDAPAGGCGVRFSGDYHDPIRFYTNVASICDAHDVPLADFMKDVDSGNLPDFAMLIPTKKEEMHDNSVESGDAYAKSILEPLLNSKAYANGDIAVFFLWDENAPIPNVLIAPSIVAGTKIKISTGNPISHFSALRTWEEMLGLPMLGDSKSAPSLLPIFEGKTTE